MTEANYTKPATQLDLEARNEEGYVPSTQLKKGQDGEPSKNGYVGVDPIYQNHASHTEAPMKGDEGIEQELLNENFLADDVDFDSTATPDGQGDEEDEEEKPASPSGPSTPAPPAPPANGGN